MNGRTARLLVLVLALVTVGPASVGAQSLPTDLAFPTGPRPDSWHLWNGLAGGWNPPVLGDMLKVYRKFPFGNGQTLLRRVWRALRRRRPRQDRAHRGAVPPRDGHVGPSA